MYSEDCPSLGDLTVTKEGAEAHLHILTTYQDGMDLLE